MSKIKQWIYDLKRLPNERRGLASGACSGGALAIALILYLIMKALGFNLHATSLIIFAAVAEGIASIVFFTWAQSAQNLKERGERSGN